MDTALSMKLQWSAPRHWQSAMKSWGILTAVVVFSALCPLTTALCQSRVIATCSDTLTDYENLTAEVVTALQWTAVTVIYNEDRVADLGRVLHALHEKGLKTALVGLRLADWLSGNVTQAKWLDIISQDLPSSGSYCFLLKGDFEFSVHVLREVSALFTNLTQATQPAPGGKLGRTSAWPSEWLVLVDVKDHGVLTDILAGWEHAVVIGASQPDAVVWILVRSGDKTRLDQVGSLCSSTAPLSRSRLLPNLAYGLNGRALRVVVKQRHGMANKVAKGGHQGFEGAWIDIVHELSLQLNFTYHLLESTEESWGQELDNGQWDGPIGFLTRGEADLAASTFRITLGRAAVADHTSPYQFDDAVLVFKTLDTSTTSSYNDFFLRPLKSEVYAVLLGCLLWVFLLLLLSRCCHHATQGQGDGEPELTRWLMTDAEVVVAAMLNRSHDPGPSVRSRAGHVLLITWVYVSVVVVGYTYSSQLTASLTVQEVSPPFSSLQQLVIQDTYTWGVAGGAGLHSILQASDNRVYQQFLEGVTRFAQTHPHVLSPDDDVQLRQVVGGRYAFLMGSNYVLPYWQSLHCHLSSLAVPGFHKPAVFYLQKHSPYTPLISQGLSRMQESGMVTRILQKWTPEKKRCGSRDVTSEIHVEQTQTAFYLLGIGVGLAAVTLTVEVWMQCSGDLKKKRLK